MDRAKVKRRWYWRLDPHSRIVIRHCRAVALTWLEFAIFAALHRTDKKHLLTSTLIDRVYAGVKNPPLYPQGVVLLTTRKLNKKLARLDIRICSENHRHRSLYRLVSL